MDGLMLYHYMNIASPRISNQLSVLAFKFHPNLTIFAGESSYKSHWTPGNWTPSQQEHHHQKPTYVAWFTNVHHICCLNHLCWSPLNPNWSSNICQMATSKVLVCFPKRCNRRISCFSTLVLANSGSCGLSGNKNEKTNLYQHKTTCKKESL